MVNWRYIGRELMVLLPVMYAVSIAGTLSGLVMIDSELTSLAALLIAGAWLIHASRQPGRLPTLVLPLLGLGVALSLATLFSSDPRRSLIQLGYWAVVTLSYWVAAEASSSQSGRERLARALFATLSALALIGLYQVMRGWSVSGFQWALTVRPGSVFGNPNTFSTALLAALVLTIQRLRATENRTGRLIATIWLLMLGGALFLAGARSAWIGAGVGTLVYLWFTLKQAAKAHPRPEQRRLAFNRTLGIGVATLLLMLLAGVILSIRPGHGTFAQRLTLWRSGWQAFLARPLVGWGPMTFGSLYMRYDSVPPETVHAHPHNLILYLAAETGLPGVLSLGWLVLVAVQEIKRLWQTGQTDQAAAAATLLAALLTNAMFDVTFLPSIAVLALWVWVSLVPARPEVRPLDLRLRRIAAPILALFAVGLWGLPIPAEMAAWDGVAAAWQEDWQAASRHFRRAARRDPALVVYQFQAAYADGQAGVRGDEQALERAITTYRTALAREPAYALHWANLAILEAHAGQMEQALADAEHAAMLVPGDFNIPNLRRWLQGEDVQVLTDPAQDRPGAYFGIGPEYSWYLFHVPGPDMHLLPLPVFDTLP